MIQLPNLDNQNYADIVETAKRRIPVICPQWTDFNEHDPGITIIELFAWLKEMQQYYLNRISDCAYENMLTLAGIFIEPTAPAKALVSFGENAPDKLIKGSYTQLNDGIVYENPTEFIKAPFVLGHVFAQSENGFLDVTDISGDISTEFYPFGSKLNVNGKYLYIEITAILSELFFNGFELYFGVSDRYPIARNPANESSIPMRDIRWEYGTKSGFAPCEVLSDETMALSYSGMLTLKTGRDFARCTVDGLSEGLWIRVGLYYPGCEEMPAISQIFYNCFELAQYQRDSDMAELLLEGNCVKVCDRLLLEGLCYVMVRGADGWFAADNANVERGESSAVIDLTDYAALAVNDGKANVRVIYSTESFGRSGMFYSSDGLPCQRFDFDVADELLTDKLRILVGGRFIGEHRIWREFTYTDNLLLCGAYDRCFSYDRTAKQIIFGDNENGEVPPPGTDNIIVASCARTKGKCGNIMSGNIKEISDGNRVYPLLQKYDAFGGRSRETLHHAMNRLKGAVNGVTRAVTAEDYRYIVKHTPGIRVADVHAIPFFDPDIPIASEDKLTNTITLVVIPYSTAKYPMPDAAFLTAVKRHIDDYRLITTQVKVTAPIYININITAEIICGIKEVEPVRQSSEKAVRKMLSVYNEDGSTRFGEPVSESDIIACISEVDGVMSVKYVRLIVNDARCYRDKYDRIIIPPHAVLCSNNIDIYITES